MEVPLPVAAPPPPVVLQEGPQPPLVVIRPPRHRERGSESDKRNWSTSLPSLEDLRLEAGSLGIQTEAFGRKRVELAEAIRATKAGESVVLPLSEPKKGKLAAAASGAASLDLDGILRPQTRHRRS